MGDVVKTQFGGRPGGGKTAQPPRLPRILPAPSAYMLGSILTFFDREDLTPPDAAGDQFMRPSFIGVRERVTCILYGTAGRGPDAPVNDTGDRQ